MPKKTAGKNAPQVLSVLGYEDLEERGTFARQVVRNVIDVETLSTEVQAFMDAMARIIGKLTKEVGEYHMDTIEVTAEISAKGQVSLLGTGGEVAGTGGLTFTFKRTAN